MLLLLSHNFHGNTDSKCGTICQSVLLMHHSIPYYGIPILSHRFRLQNPDIVFLPYHIDTLLPHDREPQENGYKYAEEIPLHFSPFHSP